MDASKSDGRGKAGFVLVLLLLGVAAALLILYRSASHDELPDDEWLDFEHPSNA